MWRKLLWVLAGAGVWGIAMVWRERRRMRLEAELWAAATDPLE